MTINAGLFCCRLHGAVTHRNFVLTADLSTLVQTHRGDKQRDITGNAFTHLTADELEQTLVWHTGEWCTVSVLDRWHPDKGWQNIVTR